MMDQISSAISAGQSAVSVASTPPVIVGVAVAGATVLLEVLNQCLGIDVLKEIKDWIMKRFNAIKNKLFSGPPNENSMIGRMIKAIKKAYAAVMGFVSSIRTWINKVLANIQKMIEWVNAKIQKIKEYLNNPCVRAAVASLPQSSQDSFSAISGAAPGSVSTPLPASI